MPHIDAEAMAVFSILSALIGYSYYIASIVRGNTRPHAFTWISWTIVVAILFFAQRAGGAGAGSWPTALSAVACCTIAILALWRGERRISRSDRYIFAASLIAIVIWRMTSDPLSAIMVLLVTDLLAFAPTIRKSWLYPRSETLLLYVMNAGKHLLAAFAMEQVSPSTLTYPIFAATVGMCFIVMILYRRRVERHHPELFVRAKFQKKQEPMLGSQAVGNK